MFTIFVLILSVVCSVSATTRYTTLDNVTYSYGIFANLGLTVAGYIGYIVALGLVLGALVLLIFNKGWKTGTFDNGIFFNRRSLEYQRAFGESGIFDDLNELQTDTGSHELFWEDRIKKLAEKFKA